MSLGIDVERVYSYRIGSWLLQDLFSIFNRQSLQEDWCDGHSIGFGNHSKNNITIGFGGHYKNEHKKTLISYGRVISVLRSYHQTLFQITRKGNPSAQSLLHL